MPDIDRPEDLAVIVQSFFQDMGTGLPVDKCVQVGQEQHPSRARGLAPTPRVQLYLECRALARNALVDGANHKPHYRSRACSRRAAACATLTTFAA